MRTFKALVRFWWNNLVSYKQCKGYLFRGRSHGVIFAGCVMVDLAASVK